MNPVAAVLIPTYNEAADIEACLRHVAAQDVGAGNLEVILADGESEDDTLALASAAADGCGFGRFEVVSNPARRTAAGLHAALRCVTAPCVVRVDARSRIRPGHVHQALTLLAERPEVGVVGGAQVPAAGRDDVMARGIARALGNRFTTGLSRYRRSGQSGITDTVWMGAFRTAELRALEGWDPGYGINEDYELNSRYREAGFLVWFDTAMAAGYVPRSDLGSLARQYFSFGRAKGAQWRAGDRPAPRHLVLLGAPPLGALSFAVAVSRLGIIPASLLAVVAVLLVDHVGSASAPATPAMRGAAVAATATFQAAWWLGAVTALVRPGRDVPTAVFP